MILNLIPMVNKQAKKWIMSILLVCPSHLLEHSMIRSLYNACTKSFWRLVALIDLRLSTGDSIGIFAQ